MPTPEKLNSVDPSALHDAELISLTYDAAKTISLTFLTDHGAQVRMVLRGVERFVANQLMDGNIVLDVQSTKFGNLDPQSIEAIVRDAFPDEFVASPSERASTSIHQWQTWLAAVRAGTLHLVVVEPSYGAEIVAVCSDIELLANPCNSC